MTIDECFEHYEETGDSEFDTEYEGVYCVIKLSIVRGIDTVTYGVKALEGHVPTAWAGWARY